MPDQTIPPAVGFTFPDAPIMEPNGRASRLHEQLTQPATIMYFMRSPQCPVCNAHVRSLTREANAGSYGDAKVVVIVPGKANEASRVAQKTGAAIAVWASTSAHETSGLHAKAGLQQSGTFVLDANGTVLAARVATVPTGAFDHGEVIAALREHGAIA